MNKARVRIDGIAAQVYWLQDKGFDKTAMVAPGLPYITDQEPIAPLLAELGYGVIQPQYMGTFDSDGVFSPKASIDTILKVNDILSIKPKWFDLRGERWFEVAQKTTVIVAHSFGTYAAMGAILRGLNPQIAIMFSPMFEFGIKKEIAGLKVDLEKHLRHILKALPLTFRIASPTTWRNFFTTNKKFHPLPSTIKSDEKVKLFCIVGDSDPSINANLSYKYVKQFTQIYKNRIQLIDYKIIKGGTHDVRSLLTKEVCDFIRPLIS